MKFPKFNKPHFSVSKSYATLRKSRQFRRARTSIEKKPFTSFFVALAVLFGLIVAGSLINSLTRKEAVVTTPVKNVTVYTIGQTPKVTYQAQVEKSGVIKIVAQTPGIVQQINVTDGQEVGNAQTLVSLSTNYQGGNAQGLQSQLAQAQLQNVLDTYDSQKEVIGKQREVADQTSSNAEELRNIQGDSVNDIQTAVNTNNTILTTLQTNLQTLETSNVGGANDALILQTQQGISQVQGGLLQLNSQLKSNEYQSSNENPPANLANLQKDITKKQLDLQEKSLELTKASAQIQANLASVNAALMYPASPCAGKVERIHVRVGEAVQPGTVIATISGISDQITAQVLVPREIALSLSRTEPSMITLGKESIEATPYYIATNATDGQLYAALYTIPADKNHTFTDGEYVPIRIPVGVNETASIPFIPIDSVYQTQEATYVYVVKDNIVTNKEITLGTIFGKFAEVSGGLTNGDAIVLSRNVVSGEKVKITN